MIVYSKDIATVDPFSIIYSHGKVTSGPASLSSRQRLCDSNTEQKVAFVDRRLCPSPLGSQSAARSRISKLDLIFFFIKPYGVHSSLDF